MIQCVSRRYGRYDMSWNHGGRSCQLLSLVSKQLVQSLLALAQTQFLHLPPPLYSDSTACLQQGCMYCPVVTVLCRAVYYFSNLIPLSICEMQVSLQLHSYSTLTVYTYCTVLGALW